MTKPDNVKPCDCCQRCQHANMMHVDGSHLIGLGCFLGEHVASNAQINVDAYGWSVRRVDGYHSCPSFTPAASPAE